MPRSIKANRARNIFIIKNKLIEIYIITIIDGEAPCTSEEEKSCVSSSLNQRNTDSLSLSESE